MRETLCAHTRGNYAAGAKLNMRRVQTARISAAAVYIVSVSLSFINICAWD